jgi:hypothetical protein
MKSAQGRRAPRAAVAACLSIVAGSAWAQTTLELGAGVEHTDNVARTATDEESETIGTASVKFGLKAERPRLTSDIGANLQYRRYLDDTFDNELVGGLDGKVSYAFIPERFVLVVEDNYGQIANDRSQVETPDNRQNFNYFTAGPDITLPLGARTAVQARGRWSDSYFENSEDDSQSVEGSLGLIRTLSEMTSVSLNASVSTVEFDESETLEDSEIREAFFRIDAIGARTTFFGDFGYTETEQGDIASDGPLVRLTVSRAITPRSTLSLTAGSEFADTGTAFRLDQGAVGVQVGNQDVVAAADVFRTNYAYLTFATEQERTSFSATARTNRERHETQIALDRDVLGAEIALTRRLTSRLSLELRGTYNDEEFVETDIAFDEWGVGAGLLWQLNTAWRLRLSGDHFSGAGDTVSGLGGVAVPRDYDENRAALTVTYAIGR